MLELRRSPPLYSTSTMMEEPNPEILADHWLSKARLIIPTAVEKSRATSAFPGRWHSIISKLEQLSPCLSNLSSHPFFSKNPLFREQLQSVCATVEETIDLSSRTPTATGKLQMQSYLDSLSAKLDLNLRDCNQLIKTGVLGDSSLPLIAGQADAARLKVQNLLARLQIGHADAKHRAIEGLIDAISEDETCVRIFGRNNISALVQLLAAGPSRTREKAAAIVCLLAASGSCNTSMISEGVLPPLIKLLESGTPIGRQKAAMTLECLSMSGDIARSVAGHGGITPLVAACGAADSITQSAAIVTVKNLSAVPEVRQILADEGVIRLMIRLLDGDLMLRSKEHAAECLQRLTSSNESLRRAVVAEGGFRSLLAYLNNPLPQESAVAAVKNLVSSISIPTEMLVSTGLLPRLVHVLKEGSVGAQQAAAATICRISRSTDVKNLMGELGCMPLLVRLMEEKRNGAREAAAQAIASLITCTQNCKEVKKEEKIVPNLVQLLHPGSENTAKKYAVSCLLCLSSSKRCKKLMCSHGAIGYVKKLSETDVPGARKLLDKLEKGKVKSFFIRI